MSGFISPTKLKLSNGLTVLYLKTKNDPISACHLFFPGGSIDDSNNQSGLTNMMWALFLKGTKSTSAKKIAERIESLGAHIGAGATHDYSHVSLYSLSEYFEETFDIMADSLFNPIFTREEFQKEKS